MAKPGKGSATGAGPETFDARERAFETKYRHDEEIAFRAEARCAHLLGLWAAAKLGLAGQAAEDYSQTVREADLTRPNHAELISKLLADFAAKGVGLGEAQIIAERERLLDVAKTQLFDELRTGKQRLEPGL